MKGIQCNRGVIARAGRFAALAATLVCLDVAGASTLGTESQRAREELALKVLASGPVQEQLARTETLYGQSQPSRTPSGKSTIESAAKSIALASVQYALSEDGSHPVAMWSCNAPHRWFGLDVPRSGYGVDNPDNVYRWVAIDGVSKYEIRGHMKEPGPLQETFILYSSIPGMNPMNREGAGMVGTLRSDQMSIGPDGSFTITIDPDPAGGRPNHIQSNSTAKLLIVRDTLSDWSKQNPVALDVRRIAGPAPGSPPTMDQLDHRAAEILAKTAPFWVNYFDRFTYAKPANVLEPPFAREGGWGFASGGHFNLADDEALIVTLDPQGAGYLGFQLADPWGVAPEYADRNGSLNQSQAKPNADGTYTYVISAKDPGVYNWLDPSGLDAGLFTVRWQAVPASAKADQAVREVRVVKLSALKGALPRGTVFVTAEDRKAQLEERARSYARRLE